MHICPSPKPQEPVLLSVGLLCDAPGSLPEAACWRRSDGGRRCRCPYESFQGLNITLDRAAQLDLQMHPYFLRNSSAGVRCEMLHSPESRHCIVSGESLRQVFHGGSAEMWVHVQQEGVLSRAAFGSFVIEAPRVRATPPISVKLCLEEGLGFWADLLPSCRAEQVQSARFNSSDTTSRVARADKTLTSISGLASIVSSTGATLGGAGSGRVVVRAEWVPGASKRCLLPQWEVRLFMEGSRSPVLCRAGGWSTRGMSCIGKPQVVTTGVRAAVIVHCENMADGPTKAGFSAWYFPLERASLSGMHAGTFALNVPTGAVPERGWTLWCSFGLVLFMISVARIAATCVFPTTGGLVRTVF